jgi:hypothetical protein
MFYKFENQSGKEELCDFLQGTTTFTPSHAMAARLFAAELTNNNNNNNKNKTKTNSVD